MIDSCVFRSGRLLVMESVSGYKIKIVGDEKMTMGTRDLEVLPKS
jgi:hypothetical protein